MRDFLLTDDAALDRVAAVWGELWQQTRPMPPMLEPFWVRTWWQAHRHEVRPFLVLVEDEHGRAVGLAPLALRTEGMQDPRRCLRTISFLGTGERETDEVVGEYTTWLARPEHMGLVTQRVAGRLIETEGSWDRLCLERMSPESGIADALPPLLSTLTSQLERSEMPSFRSPVRPLEQFVQAVASTSFRTRCRRSLRAGREEGVEYVRASSPADLAEMYQALKQLHQQRWIDRGQPGAFASPLFNDFQQKILQHYPDRGQMWLVGLRHGGRWLAVRCLLRVGDCLYDYLSGVDTSGTSTALAPGLLLHLHTIDACAREGIATYDLMAGDYDYKRKLASQESSLPTIELFGRTLRARLWLGARGAARRLREAHQRFRAPAPADTAAAG